MVFNENIKRGRKKGLKGNQVIVRRHISPKYNQYELKDKKTKKRNNGQCRLTLPRAIADSLELRDGDVIEFINHTKESLILRKVDEHDFN